MPDRILILIVLRIFCYNPILDDGPYKCPMTDYIDSGPGAYGPSTYKTNCKNGKYVFLNTKDTKIVFKIMY